MTLLYGFNIGKLDRTSNDCKFGQTVSHLSVTAFVSSICKLERMRSLCAGVCVCVSVCVVVFSHVEEGVKMVLGRIFYFPFKQALPLRKHLERERSLHITYRMMEAFLVISLSLLLSSSASDVFSGSFSASLMHCV